MHDGAAGVDLLLNRPEHLELGGARFHNIDHGLAGALAKPAAMAQDR